MVTRKTAIGIGIGSLTIALGSYLLIQSMASNVTPEIIETGLTEKGGSLMTQSTTSSINPIQVAYSNFTIPYSISNAKVLGIKVDSQSKILLVSIKTSGAGNLTMEIPRALIDSKFGAHDDRFSVLLDGQEIDYEESKTDTSRTLTISFPNGIQQIQVKVPSLPNRTHVANTNFSVGYNITNGRVLDLKADVQSQSMIISIKPTADGVLTIAIPRGLIDAQAPNQQDDKFFVLTDGREADYTETKTTTERTLTIPFTFGTEQIEIIGTWY